MIHAPVTPYGVTGMEHMQMKLFACRYAAHNLRYA